MLVYSQGLQDEFIVWLSLFNPKKCIDQDSGMTVTDTGGRIVGMAKQLCTREGLLMANSSPLTSYLVAFLSPRPSRGRPAARKGSGWKSPAMRPSHRWWAILRYGPVHTNNTYLYVILPGLPKPHSLAIFWPIYIALEARESTCLYSI